MRFNLFNIPVQVFCLSLFLNLHTLYGQNPVASTTKTKLVVGIVVDQMRNDYLYRYWSRFGNGGFKRLVNEGFYFKNAHYNYIPTYTGPGHSSIYTGATPRAHGIIANDWYVKTNGTFQYCVSDTSVKGVGTNGKSGKMSPKNQISSTIGDELKMSMGPQSKVFALALKDRSAILPAGHAADAAYWFDDQSGTFISSTWYVQQLPQWLKTFNEAKWPQKYLNMGWSPLYPITTYTNSLPDDNRYEAAPNGQEKAVFPYEYSKQVAKANWGMLKATPYGNSITTQAAIECIRAEKLGKDDITDLLCLSFSSTDIIGHSVGPRAIEMEDVYLRLDKDLEELLVILDKEVGKNNYVVFLTADHGGADVPNHLLDQKIPAGYLKESRLVKDIKNYFQSIYGDTTILASVSNDQIFLNHARINGLKLVKTEVEQKLIDFLLSVNGIAEAYPSVMLKHESFENGDYRRLLQNGYNHKMSGDIAFIYQPAWMDHGEKGTTHGAGYNYDTHVPMLFYGKGIKHGESYTYTTITQIAPSICELVKINQPNACTSEPLNNWFR